MTATKKATYGRFFVFITGREQALSYNKCQPDAVNA
jgi:hypothetical protein